MGPEPNGKKENQDTPMRRSLGREREEHSREETQREGGREEREESG